MLLNLIFKVIARFLQKRRFVCGGGHLKRHLMIDVPVGSLRFIDNQVIVCYKDYFSVDEKQEHQTLQYNYSFSLLIMVNYPVFLKSLCNISTYSILPLCVTRGY